MEGQALLLNTFMGGADPTLAKQVRVCVCVCVCVRVWCVGGMALVFRVWAWWGLVSFFVHLTTCPSFECLHE